MAALQLKTNHSAVMLIHSSLAFQFTWLSASSKLEKFRAKDQINDTTLLYIYLIYLTFTFNLFIGYVKCPMQYPLYEAVPS